MTTPNETPKSKSGIEKTAFEGLPSTLCSGCGHDSITRHIITAYFESDINPRTVAKMSGIGCSSKTPAYFLSQAHGFNAVHGRMPSVATGAKLANHKINLIGVSGDGDTASIGMGQFMHMVRRNTEIVYIVENNGVYGLTKGQFSATADKGSVLKKGSVNELDDIDVCAVAIQMGCNYVGRSFSGDGKQMVPLIKGAIRHKGCSVLDVVSPCVTFNNHEGSTKSFTAVKQNDVALHEIGFHPYFETPEVDLKPGEVRQVELPDGSVITLKKLHEDYDPSDRMRALGMIAESKAKGQLLTGLLYANPKNNKSMVEHMKLSEKPLYALNEQDCRVNAETFAKIQNALR